MPAEQEGTIPPFHDALLHELESKLRNGSYIGDYIGKYYGVIRGILGVQTITHIAGKEPELSYDYMDIQSIVSDLAAYSPKP